jgi:hypothetical protein
MLHVAPKRSSSADSLGGMLTGDTDLPIIESIAA